MFVAAVEAKYIRKIKAIIVILKMFLVVEGRERKPGKMTQRKNGVYAIKSFNTESSELFSFYMISVKILVR